jgi:DNA-directed RNA polymerase specialized sigma24 family protein
MATLSREDEELDLEARIGLLGTAQEKQDAVRTLFARYGTPVMSFLADHFPDIDPEERANAVHDAFRAIYQKAEDRTLDADKPLGPLAFTIAKRRALDARRKNSCRIKPDVQIGEVVGDLLAGTDTGADWNLVRLGDKAEEVQKEFRRFVATLKGQQRRVASIMADCLPDWLSDQEIAQEIQTRTTHHITTLEVKGAKNALMKKFREILQRKRNL